ncbi:MAG: hypothetical protein CMI53_04050 [Parcubacteria group bacterium]|jgi:hypothetical protein|nr:hypothetical protein [Parcubacteria group bacterium]
MDDFVQVPRRIKYDFIDSKITHNEFEVLVWIFLNTNPHNGRFETSYLSLVEDFKEKIKYDNMRKIISSLRRHNWVWFKDHRGRGGKFTIKPLNFQLTNKHIQSIEDFTITTKDESLVQPMVQQAVQPSHNLDTSNHNLKEDKDKLMKHFSMADNNESITTPYNKNDNKNENNNNLIVKKLNNSTKEERNIGGRAMLKETIDKINAKRYESKNRRTK